MNETPFWSKSVSDILSELKVTADGLSDTEAKKRLATYGSNLLKPKKRTDVFSLLVSQFKSPLILILLFAAGLSFFVHDHTDAVIILVFVLASSLLGFWQEKGAANAIEKLLAIVHIKANVFRDSKEIELLVENIVPGDIVILNAGDVIPGDS